MVICLGSVLVLLLSTGAKVSFCGEDTAANDATAATAMMIPATMASRVPLFTNES
jgi:hypothetical protein